MVINSKKNINQISKHSLVNNAMYYERIMKKANSYKPVMLLNMA